MKVAAVVILYNPPQDAISNIQSYYDWVDKIFVFDNSEAKSAIQDDLIKLSKIEFYQDFKNEGIARRLNQACEMAIKEQYDWLLTMDQDSKFNENSLATYFDCFKNYQHKEKVAMFGTSFSRKKQLTSPSCAAINAEKLITSGSLLNLSLFTSIGGFDEKLFIDAVDYDYCFRAKMTGHEVVQFLNIYILHTVGNEAHRSSIKTLYLIRKKKEVHSPLRCYYMYRNMLYLAIKYKGQNKKYSKQIKDYVLSRIKVSFLYGRTTIAIVKQLMEAKSDFKKGKMGKKEART